MINMNKTNLFEYLNGWGDCTKLENIETTLNEDKKECKLDDVKYAKDINGIWHDGYFFKNDNNQIMFLSRFIVEMA